MKAYQVVENGKPLEEKDLETPTPKGNEVLLKTVACGVCHSDVHIHDGYFDLGGGVQLPSPLPDYLIHRISTRSDNRVGHRSPRDSHC